MSAKTEKSKVLFNFFSAFNAWMLLCDTKSIWSVKKTCAPAISLWDRFCGPSLTMGKTWTNVTGVMFYFFTPSIIPHLITYMMNISTN